MSDDQHRQDLKEKKKQTTEMRNERDRYMRSGKSKAKVKQLQQLAAVNAASQNLL